MILYDVSEKGDLTSISKLTFDEGEVYLVNDERSIYIWIGDNASKKQQDAAISEARVINKKKGNSAKMLLINQGKEYGSFMAMMDTLKEGIKEDEEIERRPEFHLEPPTPDQEKKVDDDMLHRLGGWLSQLMTYRTKQEFQPEDVAIVEPEEIKEEESKPEAPKLTEEKPKIQEDQMDQQIEDALSKEEKEEDSFEDMVRVAAYFISENQLTYDELCWVLAERQLSLQRGDENVSKEDVKSKAEQVFQSSCTYDELCWLIGEVTVILQKNEEFM